MQLLVFLCGSSIICFGTKEANHIPCCNHFSAIKAAELANIETLMYKWRTCQLLIIGYAERTGKWLGLGIQHHHDMGWLFNVYTQLHHEKTNILHWQKTKAEISFTVTAKQISAFVFTTIPLLSETKISNPLAISCTYTAGFVLDLFVNHIDGFLSSGLIRFFVFSGRCDTANEIEHKTQEKILNKKK